MLTCWKVTVKELDFGRVTALGSKAKRGMDFMGQSRQIVLVPRLASHAWSLLLGVKSTGYDCVCEWVWAADEDTRGRESRNQPISFPKEGDKQQQ